MSNDNNQNKKVTVEISSHYTLNHSMEQRACVDISNTNVSRPPAPPTTPRLSNASKGKDGDTR